MEHNSIMRRRSVRKFEDRPVEQEKLEHLLRAAMQSPTAKDSRCWEFLVITDRAACEAISKMSEYAMCAAKAPAMVITMVNLHNTDPDTLWWVEDLSAATQTILIQAEEEGLGAVWLGMYPREERTSQLQAYFQLPEHIMPFAVIPLGYKQKEKPFEDRFDPAKVHWDTF
ncbi:MAG: nitroreductase [Oscillospiraceae bacterium]|nr:nitroreductase [Oscillospiraceae bacterium]